MPTRTAFLNVFSIGNLMNSCALYRSHACTKELKHAFQNKTKFMVKFSTLFTIKEVGSMHLLKYFGLKMI